MPSYSGISLKDMLEKRNGIKGIDAVFSIVLEHDDNVITGDAKIELTDGTLNLRVYSLGFLVAEVSESDGVVISNPKIDGNKRLVLVEGLRNSFFWWTIKNYETEEMENSYILWDGRRKVSVNKETFLPLRQNMELDDGRILNISYDSPLESGDFWYPSEMKIELSKYKITLNIKTLTFIQSLSN